MGGSKRMRRTVKEERAMQNVFSQDLPYLRTHDSFTRNSSARVCGGENSRFRYGHPLRDGTSELKSSGKKGQNYLLAKSQSTLRSSIAMTFKILNRP